MSKNKNKIKDDKTTKISLVIITILLFIGLGFIFASPSNDSKASLNNVEVKDGVQYITIEAKGGYTPSVSLAQALIPTKIIMKTKGTYDCSLSLTIPEIQYRKMLPQTGETEIDLGEPKVGTLRGLCSMGMYNFAIDFK